MQFSLRTLFVTLTLVTCVGGSFRFMYVNMMNVRVIARRTAMLRTVLDSGGSYHSNDERWERDADKCIDLIRIPDEMSWEAEYLRRIFPEAEVVVDRNIPF